jgi:hypothetical protein
MNQTMRIRALLLMAGLVAVAGCGEPLGKQPMLAGCAAAALAVAEDLRGAPMDYRAVVGREAILRYQVPQAGGEARAVTVKCKVNTRGSLRRIKIEAVRSHGRELDTAKAAFAGAVGK